MRVLVPCRLLAPLVLVGCGLAGRADHDGPPASSGPVTPVIVPPAAGTGAFASSPTSPTPVVVGIPTRLVVADVDGDGRGDVVVGDADPITPGVVWLRAGDGGVLEAPRPVAALGAVGDFDVADLDEDGWPDVVAMDAAVEQVRVFRNQRDGTFLAGAAIDFAAGAAWVRVGRFSDDSHLDVVIAFGNTVWLCKGDGAGGFAGVSGGGLLRPPTGGLAVGSIDTSWTHELVTATQLGGGPATYWDVVGLDPTGTDPLGEVSSSGVGYAMPVVLRLDGDPYGDVAVVRGAAELQLFTGYVGGQGHLGLVSHPMPGAVSGLAAADLDLDGTDDLVVAMASLDRVDVGRGDGAGDLVGAMLVTTPSPQHVALGDVDGDGVKDLVTSSATGAVTVRLGVAAP